MCAQMGCDEILVENFFGNAYRYHVFILSFSIVLKLLSLLDFRRVDD